MPKISPGKREYGCDSSSDKEMASPALTGKREYRPDSSSDEEIPHPAPKRVASGLRLPQAQQEESEGESSSSDDESSDESYSSSSSQDDAMTLEAPVPEISFVETFFNTPALLQHLITFLSNKDYLALILTNKTVYAYLACNVDIPIDSYTIFLEQSLPPSYQQQPYSIYLARGMGSNITCLIVASLKSEIFTLDTSMSAIAEKLFSLQQSTREHQFHPESSSIAKDFIQPLTKRVVAGSSKTAWQNQVLHNIRRILVQGLQTTLHSLIEKDQKKFYLLRTGTFGLAQLTSAPTQPEFSLAAASSKKTDNLESHPSEGMESHKNSEGMENAEGMEVKEAPQAVSSKEDAGEYDCTKYLYWHFIAHPTDEDRLNFAGLIKFVSPQDLNHPASLTHGKFNFLPKIKKAEQCEGIKREFLYARAGRDKKAPKVSLQLFFLTLYTRVVRVMGTGTDHAFSHEQIDDDIRESEKSAVIQSCGHMPCLFLYADGQAELIFTPPFTQAQPAPLPIIRTLPQQSGQHPLIVAYKFYANLPANEGKPILDMAKGWLKKGFPRTLFEKLDATLPQLYLNNKLQHFFSAILKPAQVTTTTDLLLSQQSLWQLSASRFLGKFSAVEPYAKKAKLLLADIRKSATSNTELQNKLKQWNEGRQKLQGLLSQFTELKNEESRQRLQLEHEVMESFAQQLAAVSIQNDNSRASSQQGIIQISLKIQHLNIQMHSIHTEYTGAVARQIQLTQEMSTTYRLTKEQLAQPGQTEQSLKIAQRALVEAKIHLFNDHEKKTPTEYMEEVNSSLLTDNLAKQNEALTKATATRDDLLMRLQGLEEQANVYGHPIDLLYNLKLKQSIKAEEEKITRISQSIANLQVSLKR